MSLEPVRHLGLLRAVVRADVPALERALADPATDVQGFFRFAHRHQLGAYSYWTLQRLGLSRRLSPRLLAATKASSLTERTRTDRLVRELRDLAEVFERGGAEVLFIKGPLFAERFYGSVAARAFADLDVLLRAPGDLAHVEALLLAAGFERAFRILVSRRMSRYFSHHFEYRRDDVSLDVHWALQRHFTFAIDYARIAATSVRIAFDGRSYDAVSDEYELVLQILGVLTDLQVGKLGLRSLIDIYRIVKTVEGHLDWDAFLSSRERERLARVSLYVLAAMLDVLDCRDDFPGLGSVLDRALHRVPPVRLARDAALASRPLALGQKLLAFRLYETSIGASLAWWLVSLPFRFAVYGAAPLQASLPRRRATPD